MIIIENSGKIQMKLVYVLRKPVFPLIIDINNYVFSTTENEFWNKIWEAEPEPDSYYKTMDATGEGFMFSYYKECFVLSPLTMEKNFTKKEIIQWYNNRRNKNNDIPYSEKSLSAKPKQRIIKDIIDKLS